MVEQKTQKDNADWEYVYLTGSHIPQRVKKRNIITVGKNGPVLTIDQREMERNGNQPVAEQLNRYPGVSVSGRHYRQASDLRGANGPTKAPSIAPSPSVRGVR